MVRWRTPRSTCSCDRPTPSGGSASPRRRPTRTPACSRSAASSPTRQPNTGPCTTEPSTTPAPRRPGTCRWLVVCRTVGLALCHRCFHVHGPSLVPCGRSGRCWVYGQPQRACVAVDRAIGDSNRAHCRHLHRCGLNQRAMCFGQGDGTSQVESGAMQIHQAQVHSIEGCSA
jgi:hypothetical protein